MVRQQSNPWPAILVIGAVVVILVLVLVIVNTGKSPDTPPPYESAKTAKKSVPEEPSPFQKKKTRLEKDGEEARKTPGPKDTAALFFDAIATKNRRNLERYFDYPRYRKTVKESKGEKDDWLDMTLFDQEKEKEAFFLPLLKDEKVRPFLDGELTLKKENEDYGSAVLTYHLEDKSKGLKKEYLLHLFKDRDQWVVNNLTETVLAEKKKEEEEGFAGRERLGGFASEKEEENEEKAFLKLVEGKEDSPKGVPKYYLEGVVTKVELLPETTAKMKREIENLYRTIINPSLTREGLLARDELKKLGKLAIPPLLNKLVDLDMTREKDVFKAHQVIQVLQGITKKNFGFSPRIGGAEDSLTSGSAMMRESAIKSWFGWWEINKEFFTADLGRLVEEDKEKERMERRKKDKEKLRKRKK
jgi:hypothetical protein